VSTLGAGTTLLHFRIEKMLGQGGMGEVYRAIDTKLGRPVALKLLPLWAISKPEAARRFREEARLASALNHPNIVTIHAVEVAEGHEFIVMELVEGETLLERSRREPLEFPTLLTLGIQVSEALAAAHAIGLIHRDIKSANILITREGDAKVTDFGLAKRLETEAGGADGATIASFTQTGIVMGTPAYMSPEQTRGETLDPRSDIFSLGVTLYEGATGRLPFEGPSVLGVMHAIATAEAVPPSHLRQDCPAEFDLILARALAKDPNDRWALARDFADAMKGLRDGPAHSTAAVALPQAPASKVPHNLPAQLTSFIGRRRERAEVRRLFAAARLVTVMGAGGTGKTRLALQVAADMLAEEPDGAWLVELAALADPALVPQTAANALGVREEPGRPLEATLADAIGSKRMILVLDNCEHLAAACAALAAALLRVSPNLRILATSQEGLGVAGEFLWRIPTLSVPDVRLVPSTSKESAARFEAVRLFVARAVAAHPGFVLTDVNAPMVAQICHRLDGIPLAIELAASRVKVLAVEKILARLTDRFQLLTGGSRTALPRQQTLRAAVDWSYELLTSKERTLLNRLGVFAGGCVLESAEEICTWDGLQVEDVLEYLTNLVGKSLVGSHEGADGGMRYGLLETIRAYAAERARETGEADALAERHAACFLRLAEAAEPELQGPEQARWLDRLEEEYDNLRQAFQAFIARRQAEAALRLCGALWRFWWIRGNWKEGRDWLESALHLEGASQRTPRRSKALRCASRLALTQGDDDAARAHLNEGLEIARELADKTEIAACLFELGNVANQHELLAEARQLYGECLTLQREIADRRGTSLTLHNLAVVAEARQEFAEAHTLYQEALALHRSLGNQAMEAKTRNGLGVLAVAQGDLGTARTHHEQALAIQRDLGDKSGIAFSLRELGAIVAEQGDVPTGCAHLAECMEILRELGDRQELAPAIEACACVAARAGQGERALQLAGAASALRDELACPISKSDEEVLQGRLAGARKVLGAEASQRCMEEGRVLGVEQAIELAIETGSQAAARSRD
jgi:predicted ATPase